MSPAQRTRGLGWTTQSKRLSLVYRLSVGFETFLGVRFAADYSSKNQQFYIVMVKTKCFGLGIALDLDFINVMRQNVGQQDSAACNYGALDHSNDELQRVRLAVTAFSSPSSELGELGNASGSPDKFVTMSDDS